MKMHASTFYTLVAEVVANHRQIAHGLSAEENRALSVYVTERRRGGDVERTFEYAHPQEFALLSKVVADFAPQARTMSDLQTSNLDEAEIMQLRTRWLESALHRLAEARGEEAPTDRKPGMWSS